MRNGVAISLGMLFFNACTAEIGGGTPPGSVSPAVPAGGSGGTGGAAMAAPQAADLSQQVARRLTRVEFNHTLRDLLGDATSPANAFPVDEDPRLFDNNANALSFPPALADAAFRASAGLASLAWTHRAQLVSCSEGPDCARQLITGLGAKAWRRPLQPSEVDRLLTVFARGEGRAGRDPFELGLKLVVQALLMAPDFWYRFEFGDGSAVEGRPALTHLTSWEMASRLSYSLWNTMPDDALFELAAADQLRTPEAVSAQVQRMLADPKAEDAMRHFQRQWLALDMSGVGKVDYATAVPFTVELGAAMQREAEEFLLHVTREGKISEFFTADFSFVNKELGTLYGVPNASSLADDVFQRVSFADNPARHAGFLSMPAFLAKAAQPDRSSPVLRGVFILNRLLCRPVPQPGPDIDTTAQPASAEIKTTRQYFETQHANNPRCAGCHTAIDPIGFGFEGYDAAGLPRTEQNGVAIDDSGFSEETGAFKGPADFGAKLSASPAARACLAKQWFRFFNGREENERDLLDLSAATSAATTQDTFAALIREVAASDALLYLAPGAK